MAVSKHRRNTVMNAADYKCQAGRNCSNEATQLHHIFPQRYGGKDNIENLLAVCADCHFWIHKQVMIAEGLGLIRFAPTPTDHAYYKPPEPHLTYKIELPDLFDTLE